MSSEEVKTKTGATRRPYDEAFKRAAVAPWQSGVPATVPSAIYPLWNLKSRST